MDRKTKATESKKQSSARMQEIAKTVLSKIIIPDEETTKELAKLGEAIAGIRRSK